VNALRSAWEWIKKYWQFFVGFLILCLGVLVGVKVRSKPDEKTSDLDKKRIEEETSKKAHEADVVAVVRKEQAMEDHLVEVRDTIVSVRDKTEVLRDDSTAINDYLHKVGDDVRRKP
jgi:hypothetical protein